MRFRAVPIAFMAVSLLAASPVAQELAGDRGELTESGSDYLRALRFRGIDTDVAYYDPFAPAPSLDTSAQPEKPPQRGKPVEWSNTRITAVAVTAAILAVLAYVLFRFGGNISLSLRPQTANPGRSRGRNEAGPTPETVAVPDNLDAVLRIADRRRAVVLLAQSALAKVLSLHGVLVQKSWTARDALRHVPNDQDHIDALRTLILASERVHFGGRDVSESEFDALVARIRPLFGASGA